MKQTIYGYSRPFQGGIRQGLLLRLENEKGNVGWGEIAPLPGFSKETYEEALQALTDGDHSYPSVQWGIASATLDLLHPLDIESIPVRILHGEKIKVGHLTLDEAIKLTSQSKCVGVDMNQKWPLEKTLAFAKHFPDLEYFEEPLKPGEEEESVFFPYPVALDESLRSSQKWNYPFVKAHVIKPMLHGYPLPKKLKGVDFILSSSYESEIGIYQIAKLAYRLKIPLKPMGLGTCHLFDEPLFEKEPQVKNGKLYFPKKWSLKMDKVQVLFDGYI